MHAVNPQSIRHVQNSETSVASLCLAGNPFQAGHLISSLSLGQHNIFSYFIVILIVQHLVSALERFNTIKYKAKEWSCSMQNKSINQHQQMWQH